MILCESPKIELVCADCMDILPTFKAKQWGLACVDPPYAVGADDGMFGGSPTKGYRHDLKKYADSNNTPDKKYFDLLFDVSKNQIIWGANYYPQYLYKSGWIVWNKHMTGPLSDAELAFQSKNMLVRVFDHVWSGWAREASERGVKRIHPNQKPVNLYVWCFRNYAQPGDKILDTHLGSGSSAIAAYREGFEFFCIEKDAEYFNAAVERFKREAAQADLFKPKKNVEQLELIDKETA